MPIRTTASLTNLLLVFAISLLGLTLGIISSRFPATQPLRVISSLAQPIFAPGLNRYDRLLCPNTERMKNLSDRFHFRFDASIDHCQDPRLQKLAKLFVLMDELKVDLPNDWPQPSREALSDSGRYFSRLSRTLAIGDDKAAGLSKNIWGNVLVGDAFFELPPLAALAILQHEARHSEPMDPGHVKCGRGDLCDHSYSNGNRAGAHSFEIQYLAGLAQYGVGLSNGDQEFIKSLIVTKLADSFERDPQMLNTSGDTLWALSDKNKVYLLHPFFPRPIPVPLPALPSEERIARLESRAHSLLLYTKQNHVWQWDIASGKLTTIAAGTEDRWRDQASLFLPDQDYAEDFYLSNRNQLLLVRSDEVNPYHYQPDSVGLGAMRIISGLGRNAFILSETGQLFGLSTMHETTENAAFPKIEATPSDLRQVTGGINQDSLFAVDSAGKVFRATNTSGEESNWGGHNLAWENISIDPVKSIKEGTGQRAYLLADGRLQIKKFSESARTYSYEMPNEHFVDIAFVSLPQRSLEAFAGACSTTAAIADPWLGAGIGVTHRGHLVFGIPQNNRVQCLEVGPTAVANVSVQGQQLRLTDSKGKSSLLLPYSY